MTSIDIYFNTTFARLNMQPQLRHCRVIGYIAKKMYTLDVKVNFDQSFPCYKKIQDVSHPFRSLLDDVMTRSG